MKYNCAIGDHDIIVKESRSEYEPTLYHYTYVCKLCGAFILSTAGEKREIKNPNVEYKKYISKVKKGIPIKDYKRYLKGF